MHTCTIMTCPVSWYSCDFKATRRLYMLRHWNEREWLRRVWHLVGRVWQQAEQKGDEGRRELELDAPKQQLFQQHVVLQRWVDVLDVWLTHYTIIYTARLCLSVYHKFSNITLCTEVGQQYYQQSITESNIRITKWVKYRQIRPVCWVLTAIPRQSCNEQRYESGTYPLYLSRLKASVSW